MEQKLVSPDKELEIQDKGSENKLSRSAAEIDTINAYWFAYAYSSPFMPMIDLTFAFDELKKMIKKWLANKKEDTNHL
jgi:hypothetical protein